MAVIHTSASQPTALVTGSGGFIGGYLVAALHKAGWLVRCTVRTPGNYTDANSIVCNFQKMLQAEDWLPHLNGVDVVINVAGILRETAQQHFEQIHYTAPLALAQACVKANVGRFIQISALGIPADGGFIASKHHFDDALLTLPLNALVLRPSVVYSPNGSYGGTSLLRALAAFPAIMPLPGKGQWQIQPVAAEDLAELVLIAVNQNTTGIYEVGSPEPINLHQYQQHWRQWLRIAGTSVLAVPTALISIAVKIGEWLGRGPMGETAWKMLQRGNITTTDAAQKIQQDFGIAMRPLPQVLAANPSQVQDRWQAQLYWVTPLLFWSVIALWFISAWAGFATPAATIEHLASNSILANLQPVLLARLGGVADLGLGLWLLTRWRPRLAITAMLLLLLVYTITFGVGLPQLWLDPLGGLAKNLVLIPALAALWVLIDRR